MKKLSNFLALVLIVSAGHLPADTIAVKNESDLTFEIALIPEGFFEATPKARVAMIKNRFAIIRPGRKANLNMTRVSSIHVKCQQPPGEAKYWYVYNPESAQDLFIQLSNRNAKRKLLIKDQGASLELRANEISETSKAPNRYVVY
ncbi:MAG TPA: hypothetical protein VEL47_01215 [Myxococcota bacterium]|nr:hypothetical protein [Myxococcota bacterium]